MTTNSRTTPSKRRRIVQDAVDSMSPPLGKLAAGNNTTSITDSIRNRLDQYDARDPIAMPRDCSNTADNDESSQYRPLLLTPSLLDNIPCLGDSVSLCADNVSRAVATGDYEMFAPSNRKRQPTCQSGRDVYDDSRSDDQDMMLEPLGRGKQEDNEEQRVGQDEPSEQEQEDADLKTLVHNLEDLMGDDECDDNEGNFSFDGEGLRGGDISSGPIVKFGLSSQSAEAEDFLAGVLDAPLHELGRLSLISRLDWSLPLSAITQVIRKARLLTSLSFYSLGLQGDKHDFEDFSEALRQHPALKEIHLVDCSLLDQTIPVDSMVRALGAIPTLETVEIHALDLERDSEVELMSPSSLAALCQSKSILSLRLEDIDLNNDHVEGMSAALETNDTMKTLTLWDCNVSDTAGQRLAKILEVNTTLQKMDLSLNNLRSASFKGFAKALETNRTLWSLSLHGNAHLVAQDEDRGPGSGYDAIVEVLKEQNHVMEEIILEAEEDPRVSLYLAINRNRHLWQADNVMRAQLVNCLSSNADHLSFQYCLLRANPDLCCLNR